MWDKYSDELRDNANGIREAELAAEHARALKTRMKEDWFTVGFAEYVGIDVFNNGCSFEVEVETVLGREPRVNIFSSFSQVVISVLINHTNQIANYSWN